MSSTPMAIDSPLGANGIGKQSNGISTTAKISEMIGLYRPTKLFHRDPAPSGPGKPPPAQSYVTSIDFDDEGGLLLTSETDNTMQIYNIKEGKHQKACLSLKYGASNAMFGHAPSCIIHSSTKINNTIRYLSTHDNSYLRYFEGHEKNVTCLSLHPGADHFISCSEDNTLRIWDAASKNAAGILNLQGAHLAAWDPSGNVFAAASPTAQSIILYDFRHFDREPFATFDILPLVQELAPNAIGKAWNKLSFSNDGKSLLLGTTNSGHFVLDAFEGHLKAYLKRPLGGAKRLGAGDHNPAVLDPSSSEYLQSSAGDCCFTPDGRYVISGTRGKNVLVWDILGATSNKQLNPVHELEHERETAVLAFNPRYNFFATGDKDVVFWVPNTDGY